MIKAIKRILILTGKPIYFVLSRLVIILGLLFYAFSRKGKKRKKIKSRIIYKRLSFPKVKLPKFKLPAINVPKISPKLKLEELKITLFELKTLAKFKKFFTRKLTRLQKLQLKISVRVIIICLAAISLVLYSYFAVFRGLPSPKELESRQPDVSTKIYDRDGNLLYKIYKDQNRTIVPLTRIPLNARLATLAAEDAEF